MKKPFFAVAILATLMLIVNLARAGTHSVQSAQFPVDTRGVYVWQPGIHTVSSAQFSVDTRSTETGQSVLFTVDTRATVTYNPNGGTVSPASAKVTTGQPYGTLPTPSLAGHNFNAWFTTQSGGTQVNASTIVTHTTDHSIWARWTAKTASITFNANGGTSATTPNPTTATFELNMPFVSGIPTRTGHAFGGYYDTSASSGGTQYYTATLASARTWDKEGTSQTLWVRWTANTYTVTFNAQGGSVSPASKSVTFNATYGTLPTPTLSGHTFDGWFTTASGGAKVTASTTVTTASNHSLHAQWTVAADPMSNYDAWLALRGLQGSDENYKKWLIDPNNPDAKFLVKIEIHGGSPFIWWEPDLGGNLRTYTVEGKTNLTDNAWHSPTNGMSRFFRVRVEE